MLQIGSGNTSSETTTGMRNAIRAVRKIQTRAIDNRKRKPLTIITVAEDEEDEPFCRFCFEDETENNPLITPCLCCGSQAWVHATCLVRWRERWTPNNRRYTHCSVCASPWIVTGPRRLNNGKKYISCMYFVILSTLNLSVLLWFVLLEAEFENGDHAQWCVPVTTGIGMLNSVSNAVATTHLTDLLDRAELCTGLFFFLLNFGFFCTANRVLVFLGCWASFISASVFIGYNFRSDLCGNTRYFLRC